MTPPTADETLLRAALEALRDAAIGALSLIGEKESADSDREHRSWSPPGQQIGVAAALSGMADCFDDLADHARFLAQRTDVIWPLPQGRPQPPR